MGVYNRADPPFQYHHSVFVFDMCNSQIKQGFSKFITAENAKK